MNKNKIVIFIGGLALLIMLGHVYQTFTTWGSKERLTPVGEDFAIFWAASKLALAGQPQAAYDLTKLQEVQRAVTGKSTPPGCGWYYPPTFLLMALPLALFPYLVALALWLATTLAAYVLVVRGIAPHRLTVLLTLAFPATFWNFFYGQNGFLSAALLGGGLLLLERFPVLAGLLLGAMCFKPQLALLVPIALIAGRCWKTLVTAAVFVIFIAIITTVVFGNDVCVAFLKDIALHKSLFETGHLIHYQFVPTLFSAARLAKLGPAMAYLLQVLMMLMVTLAVIWVWWKEGPSPVSAAILVLGILLFPHFYCWYDLTILALPLAWLAWEGYQKGWLPGERPILLLAWSVPFPLIALWENLQGFLILLILWGMALRRYYRRREFLNNGLILPEN